MTMNDLSLSVNTIKVQTLTPPFGEKFKCPFLHRNSQNYYNCFVNRRQYKSGVCVTLFLVTLWYINGPLRSVKPMNSSKRTRLYCIIAHTHIHTHRAVFLVNSSSV